MGGSQQWHLQQALAKDHDLICLDLPGFGRNASMPVINRIEDFAVWVLNDLSNRGIDRFDLLGHSMGGMIVQDVIRLAPSRVARLVLYGTGPVGLLPGRFEPIETSMMRARDEGAPATARRIAATWFLDRETAPQFEACANIAEQSSLEAILAGLEAMRDWSGIDNLAHINVPTLILWGDRDRTYDWSQIEVLWSSIKGSSLAVVPNCAHAVHLEHDVHFNRLVSDFLQTEARR